MVLLPEDVERFTFAKMGTRSSHVESFYKQSAGVEDLVYNRMYGRSSLGINETFRGCLVHAPFVDKGLGNLVPPCISEMWTFIS